MAGKHHSGVTPPHGRRGSAQAQRGGKRAAKMLKKHDTDGNGVLDAEELEAVGDKRQGKKHAKRGKRMMKHLDANEDGKLSFEEMTAGRNHFKMFKKLDANEDGSLSAEEFAKAGKHRGKRSSD